jgi:hypothetical protein
MSMSSQIPGFYRIINELIAEIARERNEDPEEFKQALLRKIKEG